MTAWPFVIAAYAATGLGTLALLAWAGVRMRRAEQGAERSSPPRP